MILHLKEGEAFVVRKDPSQKKFSVKTSDGKHVVLTATSADETTSWIEIMSNFLKGVVKPKEECITDLRADVKSKRVPIEPEEILKTPERQRYVKLQNEYTMCCWSLTKQCHRGRCEPTLQPDS